MFPRIEVRLPYWAYVMLTQKEEKKMDTFKKGDKIVLKEEIPAYDYNPNKLAVGQLCEVENSEWGDVKIKGIWFNQNLFRLATADDLGSNVVPKTEEKVEEKPKEKPKAKRGGKGQQVLINGKALALRNLRFSEDLFLRAYGWQKTRGGLFKAPKGYETNSVNAKGEYDRRHAVNSQIASLSRTKVY